MNRALSRITDPDTSVTAARQFADKLSESQRAVVTAAIREREQGRLDFTANEIATITADGSRSSVETYRKRCREIVRQGVFVEAGKRKCNITGNTCVTFALVDKGQDKSIRQGSGKTVQQMLPW